MRDRVGRWILGLLGAAAIVLGALALLGVRPVGDRATTVLVAVAAVGNGIVVVRLALGRQRAG